MEEYKGVYNKEVVIFNVYKTLSGLYIDKQISEFYNIGDTNDTKFIKGKECVKTTEEEIKQLEEDSQSQNKILTPYYIAIFDLQLVVNYLVYVDINHDNTLYINNNLCEKYGINPISKRTFDKITYSQVNEEDLDTIENKTKNENPILKRKYVEIELKDSIKPAEKLFMYYLNIDNNTKYINRETLEMIRKSNIEIETTPMIIDNKNCYSISDKEIKEFKQETSMHGVEKLFTEKAKNINAPTTKKETETILVYKDCITDKLYIEKDKLTKENKGNRKLLLNKICYETSIVELENTHNKRFIIVDVYPYIQHLSYKILVCNCDDDLFIPERIISLLRINVGQIKRIRINGEIYINIKEDILDILKNLETEYTKIVFEYKRIVPANKKEH